MDLTKKEKKLARELIDRGLQKELVECLSGAEIVLQDWRIRGADNAGTYEKLNVHLRDFSKHLNRRYGYVSGSHYLSVVAAILRDGYISLDDIEGFSTENKAYLTAIREL